LIDCSRMRFSEPAKKRWPLSAGVNRRVKAWHRDPMEAESKLRAIKAIHTLVWTIFAGAILAVPVCVAAGSVKIAWGLIGFVFLEVVVLLANRMRCPLTVVAGRYTPDRQDNFDIYLPLWLARHNKEVFGGLYVAGIVYSIWVSVHAAT
jgi:hypothetical protein